MTKPIPAPAGNPVPVDTDADFQTAWDAEIRRRVEEFERGEAKVIDAEIVFAKARRLAR